MPLRAAHRLCPRDPRRSQRPGRGPVGSKYSTAGAYWSTVAQESRRSRSLAPCVPMMKPSDSRQFDDPGRRRGPIRDGSMPRRVPKASMDAILVVVRSVDAEHATQMELVKYDDVIEQFAADRSYPSLCNSVLPWATQGSRFRLDPEVSNHLEDFAREDCVAIVDRDRIEGSSGNASRSCWVAHGAVGCSVTLKCKTSRRPWVTTNQTKSISKRIVGTTRKSIAEFALR